MPDASIRRPGPSRRCASPSTASWRSCRRPSPVRWPPCVPAGAWQSSATTPARIGSSSASWRARAATAWRSRCRRSAPAATAPSCGSFIDGGSPPARMRSAVIAARAAHGCASRKSSSQSQVSHTTEGHQHESRQATSPGEPAPDLFGPAARRSRASRPRRSRATQFWPADNMTAFEIEESLDFESPTSWGIRLPGRTRPDPSMAISGARPARAGSASSARSRPRPRTVAQPPSSRGCRAAQQRVGGGCPASSSAIAAAAGLALFYLSQSSHVAAIGYEIDDLRAAARRAARRAAAADLPDR